MGGESGNTCINFVLQREWTPMLLHRNCRWICGLLISAASASIPYWYHLCLCTVANQYNVRKARCLLTTVCQWVLEVVLPRPRVDEDGRLWNYLKFKGSKVIHADQDTWMISCTYHNAHCIMTFFLIYSYFSTESSCCYYC